MGSFAWRAGLLNRGKRRFTARVDRLDWVWFYRVFALPPVFSGQFAKEVLEVLAWGVPAHCLLSAWAYSSDYIPGGTHELFAFLASTGLEQGCGDGVNNGVRRRSLAATTNPRPRAVHAHGTLLHFGLQRAHLDACGCQGPEEGCGGGASGAIRRLLGDSPPPLQFTLGDSPPSGQFTLGVGVGELAGAVAGGAAAGARRLLKSKEQAESQLMLGGNRTADLLIEEHVLARALTREAALVPVLLLLIALLKVPVVDVALPSAWAILRTFVLEPLLNAVSALGVCVAKLKDIWRKHLCGSRKVRKTPSWPRSWANFSPFIALFPPACMGQLTSSGPT
jgi:hypothetical protein